MNNGLAWIRERRVADACARAVPVARMSLLIFVTSMSACSAETVGNGELQGAWWSDSNNPTADFAIHGNQVWLDYDSQYHPCTVEGDVLVFDLGPGLGSVRNRIISLKDDKLVLKHMETEQERTLTRAKQP